MQTQNTDPTKLSEPLKVRVDIEKHRAINVDGNIKRLELISVTPGEEQTITTYKELQDLCTQIGERNEKNQAVAKKIFGKNVPIYLDVVKLIKI